MKYVTDHDLGRLRLHRPACLRRRRLVSLPAWLVYYAAVVGRLRLHRPACLRRRRLVSPPTRLAYYTAVVGCLRLHHRLAFAAADWCFRLHGWPIMPPLSGFYVFTDRPPRMTPIGAILFTVAHVVVIILLLSSPTGYAAVDWCFYLHNYASSLPVCFCYRRFEFTSSLLCNFVIMVEQLQLHCLLHRQSLLLLLRKFCYFTDHDVYMSLNILTCHEI
uniref:HGWP repeat containing protein-like n=1 Tax=Oryza sativa subsp. japonica TaxID=39947 RepID=Q6ZDX7_ORYSJ|nr:HGWP repeat containing protein-like [Oryza sativa Japonica Group]BAC83526.1 HGWP repeat containing protein-like [Oryza sativa Japonica Group]